MLFAFPRIYTPSSSDTVEGGSGYMIGEGCGRTGLTTAHVAVHAFVAGDGVDVDGRTYVPQPPHPNHIVGVVVVQVDGVIIGHFPTNVCDRNIDNGFAALYASLAPNVK